MVSEPPIRLRRTLSEAARFFALGRPPRWTLVAIPLTTLVTTALGVLPPLFVGGIVDALQHRNVPNTIRELFFYTAVALLLGVVGFLANYATSIFRETLARNIQLNLLSSIYRARFDALSTMSMGQITNRVLGDVRQLGSQLEYSLFPTLSSICAFVATIIVMVRLDYRLALVAVVSSFAILVPLRLVKRRLAALQKQMSGIGDELYGVIAETTSMSGLVAQRGIAASYNASRLVESLTWRLLTTRIKSVVAGGLAGLGSTLSNMIGPVAVLALGAYLTVRGQLSVGEIVALLIYQSRLSAPITSLSQMQVTFASMGVTVGRLLDISTLPEERSGSVSFIPGAIRFQNVRLSREERVILAGLTFDVQAGEHVAVIGPSGAGKSTITSILLRLYDPDSGDVSIDSFGLSEFTLESLRSSICLVSQDPFILDATVFENITLGRPGISPEALARVLGVARLEEVLSRLPSGLDTVVGQRGFRLSGGERQRICLARGLVQDPDILMLDEALTGVDIDTERQILADIRELFSKRTLIVVTHRLDSIVNFDRFIAVDGGLVIGEGKPSELMRDPRWARMAASWRESA
ncbi:MAG TPA: ABC transporter ATP-binding protein [Candidatus Acidoferrales bacterium]|jgi:ABC-type multidrug transport system fused ATPase/permease subunit|nr:ABC transporter ATP-binding protein [Candidatus Acidoferrales bacterium]